jgi:CheY-like chemotaxis protein
LAGRANALTYTTITAPDLILLYADGFGDAQRELLLQLRNVEELARVPVLCTMQSWMITPTLESLAEVAPIDFVALGELRRMVLRATNLASMHHMRQPESGLANKTRYSPTAPEFVAWANDTANLFMKLETVTSSLRSQLIAEPEHNVHIDLIMALIADGMRLFRRVVEPPRREQLLPMAELLERKVIAILDSLPETIDLRLRIASGLWSIHGTGPRIELILDDMLAYAIEHVGSSGDIDLVARNHSVEDTGSDRVDYLLVEVLARPHFGNGIDRELNELGQRADNTACSTAFATSQQLVTQQGGRLSESYLDGQQKTVLMLPRSGAQNLQKAFHSTNKHAPSIGLPPASFLIIDDEDVLLRALSFGLKTKGHSVRTCNQGSQGVDLYRAHRDEIDYVVLDIHLGDSSGFDVRKQLLQINPKLPIILCTGYAPPEELAKSEQDANTTVLMKPYTAAELLKRIDEFFVQRGD